MSRMRKTAVDAALSGYWQQAVSERREFELGLVIGQTSASGATDALLTGIPVPSESEDEDARSFDDVSIDWAQEYAKQINRLLPGGISIIGLYVVSAAPARSVFDQTTFYLRAVAEALSLPDEFAILFNNASSSVHYVVHVCPNTSKTSAKSIFDILDAAKTDATPAELKSSSPASSSDALALKKFTTTIAVDEQIAFRAHTQAGAAADDNEAEVERALDELQQQLLPLTKRVYSATGILKSRGGGESSSTQEVLFLTSPPAASSSQSEEDQTRRRGSFRGAISCVAFVLASEPNARDAAAGGLKRDFLKSLLLRVELLREKFAADDDASAADASRQSALLLANGGGGLAFPKRASLPWSSALGPCAHFPALLHVFQEDGEDNEQELAVQNALEILGSKVSSDAGLSFLENDSQLNKSSSSNNSKDNSKSSKSVHKAGPSAATGAIRTKSPSGDSRNSSTLFIAVAVLLVLLAILAQRFLL